MIGIDEINKSFYKLTGKSVDKVEYNSEDDTLKIFFEKKRKYYIFICQKCGCQMEESHMGKKCPECGEWTYTMNCKKEIEEVKK